MRFVLAFLLSVFSTSAHADAYSYAWTPALSQIMQIEEGLRLPGGALRLNDYARYYWGAISDGRRFVIGEYHTPYRTGDGPKAGEILINFVGGPPMVLDGGCGVVNVVWDAETEELLSVYCNGVA